MKERRTIVENSCVNARAQEFMSKLGTDPSSQGGFFAPKPLFWERPAFVIWCAPPRPRACSPPRWAPAGGCLSRRQGLQS
jgi:hypothetical protein